MEERYTFGYRDPTPGRRTLPPPPEPRWAALEFNAGILVGLIGAIALMRVLVFVLSGGG